MHREGCRNDATKMHREAKRAIIEIKLLKVNNLICTIQNLRPGKDRIVTSVMRTRCVRDTAAL